MRKYFGTDGIRGTANLHPMTVEVALRLGQAAGQHFKRAGSDAERHRVVIGKDTRLSGYMLENALTAGLTSAGMDVLLLGPVPTPAVGFLTRSMRADLGVMISASHNPAEDNGIKLFGPDGFKLSDADEMLIESLIETGAPAVPADQIGRAKRIEEAGGRYAEYAKTTFPHRGGLAGLKIVIDAANGAAYKVAPEVLWELGAEVVPVGVRPDGFNINRGCGSTDTARAQEAVVAHGADLGICLDGDADRVMILDENGTIADGDQIMGLLALRFHEMGQLRGETLVATQMSNLGLERHLAAAGIALRRTDVGDRYVVEEMRRSGFNLGGEQSGHIVMTDHATTGDGLMAALQFLGEMARTERPASELIRIFEPVPQKLVNVTYERGAKPLEVAGVRAAIDGGHARLRGRGRLFIRASGTEPKIRVMAECEDEALLSQVVEEVAEAVRNAA